MKQFIHTGLIILIALSSCNHYARIVKKGTPEEKYTAAKKYYDKKDYFRAQPLFEDLIGVYRQKKEAQEIYLLYSYCLFYQHDYTLASYHFKNYSETYSFSPYREEASFMAAKCEYEKSLPSELDQTNTKSAINRIQLFINQYPDSKYLAECNALMDELRAKLHKKTYDKAMLFYNIGDYKAAMVSMQSGINLYPDIPWKDEMTFLAAKSAYLYALNSIEKLQVERYQKAQTLLNNYFDEFRNAGEFQDDAKKLEKKINDKLSQTVKN